MPTLCPREFPKPSYIYIYYISKSVYIYIYTYIYIIYIYIYIYIHIYIYIYIYQISVAILVQVFQQVNSLHGNWNRAWNLDFCFVKPWKMCGWRKWLSFSPVLSTHTLAKNCDQPHDLLKPVQQFASYYPSVGTTPDLHYLCIAELLPRSEIWCDTRSRSGNVIPVFTFHVFNIPIGFEHSQTNKT